MISDILSAQNPSWAKTQASLGKKEVLSILGRDTWDGKRIDCLRPRYWKRPELVKTGNISWGYVYKSVEYRKEKPGILITWVVHSEDPYFQTNPYALEEILKKTQERYANSKAFPRSKTEKMIRGEEMDSVFVPLDSRLTEGRSVYLSNVVLFRSNLSKFELGLNLFIANPSKVHDLVYLPRRYWIPEFEEAYPLPLSSETEGR